jgi:hypothetical protein
MADGRWMIPGETFIGLSDIAHSPLTRYPGIGSNASTAAEVTMGIKRLLMRWVVAFQS